MYKQGAVLIAEHVRVLDPSKANQERKISCNNRVNMLKGSGAQVMNI